MSRNGRSVVKGGSNRPVRANLSATALQERFNDLNKLPISVRLGSYRADFIYWGVLGSKWWRNYAHTHSFYEICYANGGRGTFRILDRHYQIRKGDLFVAKPGEMHEIVSRRGEPLRIYFWAYTLVPAQPMSGSSTSPAGHPHTAQAANDADRSIDALIHAFSVSRCWVASYAPTMDRTLQLLCEEMAQQSPGYTRAIAALVTKLLLDTARAVTGGAVPGEAIDVPPHDQAEAVVRTAARYLRDNLSRPISVCDVAAQVDLSERHLSRLFQRVMKMSILQYLTNIRIQTASQLLLDRDLSIKQVARAVGYPDPHYFSTLFGRTMGLTPGEFRRTGGTRFLKRTGSPVSDVARPGEASPGG
jgi:AraC family L-rhamnose operon transcriptional activator RhaR